MGVTAPIIGLTADFSSSIREAGMGAGMRGVLLKPVEWHLLEKMVADLMEQGLFQPKSTAEVVVDLA